MSNFIDLTGQRFGRLVVTHRAENEKRGDGQVARFDCQCDCGSVATVSSHSLRQGNSRSCGCYRAEHAASLAASRILPMPTPDELYKQYHTRKQSTRDLAVRYGVCSVTVWKWLRAHGIVLRGVSEAACLAKRKAAWQRRKAANS